MKNGSPRRPAERLQLPVHVIEPSALAPEVLRLDLRESPATARLGFERGDLLLGIRRLALEDDAGERAILPSIAVWRRSTSAAHAQGAKRVTIVASRPAREIAAIIAAASF